MRRACYSPFSFVDFVLSECRKDLHGMNSNALSTSFNVWILVLLALFNVLRGCVVF